MSTHSSDFDGAVVLISGAARGQGRNHAVRLASLGAKVVGFDICSPIQGVPSPLATRADLDETVDIVREAGGEMTAMVADVRDLTALEQVVQHTIDQHGRLNHVMVNAGVLGPDGPMWELDPASFQTVIDINLVGAWKTIKASVPALMQSSGNRTILVTSSGAGIKGLMNVGSYVASKHGVVGIVRSLAKELGPHQIRVNAILPGNVNTPMIMNDQVLSLMVPGESSPTIEQMADVTRPAHPMGVPWVEVEDTTEAALWLMSPKARFITGTCMSVDAGSAIP